MAFALNTVKTVAEDPPIAAATSSSRLPVEGFYTNPHSDFGASPQSGPIVYYPATIPDAGFINLGFSNGFPGDYRCFQNAVPPQLQPGFAGPAVVNNSTIGYTGGSDVGSKVGGSSCDHVGKERRDNLRTGKKIKFLCSFGGKVLPRPNDGALRYVGGQTRIISVNRSICFIEFVQKMINTSGQNVMIKYQLPDEDLDALVSVSCPDDLENMMDEYEKLTESFPDGSAKLRIFLFSPSELDFSSLMHIGDLQDGGRMYVDAVNGILDDLNGDSHIGWKESIESASSAHNSDLSGTEGADNVSAAQIEVSSQPLNRGFPPMGHSNNVHEIDSRMPCANPSSELDIDPSAASLSTPKIKGGTTAAVGATLDQVVERSVPLMIPHPLLGMSSSPSPYMTTFATPYHDPLITANNVQLSCQMGSPSSIFGVAGTVYAQQSVATQHPLSLNMTMNPSIMNSGVVSSQIQPSRVGLDHYPAESTAYHRVTQLPTEQGFSVDHGQIAPAMQGVYFQQISHPEQILYSEGSSQAQPVVLSDVTPRIEDCYMCQKALPHAHSDSVTLGQKKVPANVVDSRSAYHSLHSGRLVSDVPQCYQVSAFQPRYQVMKNATTNKQFKNEFAPVGCLPLHTSDVSQYSNKCEGEILPNDLDLLAFNHLRQIHGRLENLHIRPSEIVLDNDQDKLVSDSIKKDSSEAQPKDNTLCSSTRSPGDNQPVTFEGNIISSVCPPSVVGDAQQNSQSLFINQDSWNLQFDTHFPPPKPFKIIRENAWPREPPSDNYPVYNGESTGEPVKEELQAVAEGVIASVLQSVISSSNLSGYVWNDSLPTIQQNGEVNQLNGEMQHRNQSEEIKAKLPDKINLGFPTSDGAGRLQIIKNSDLEELRELGSGTFGTVYHGKWRGTDVAIKRINDRCFAGKPSEQERMRDDFWNEAIKLADLHHPNVVAFYGVVLDGPDGTVATVTEYMVNGSLRNALQKSERGLDKRKRLLIAMDVAFGMEYLHGKNIVHFDLKSDNLLVNLRDPHRPICKVGDLGLSKVKCQTLISGGVRGTLPWMAPELLNGSSSLVSEKVDVFSYGIVMWELLTGGEPYADLHYGAIIGGIVSNTLRPAVPEQCDPDWRDLMERCWSSEPSERPSFSEIACELRAIAAKLPHTGQAQQVLPSQAKS